MSVTIRALDFDPQPADVQIIERRQPGTGSSPAIVPNDVIINGQSVMTSGPVKVHEIELGNRLVQVTLTLVARRVVIEEAD